MDIIFSDRPFFLIPNKWLRGRLIASSNADLKRVEFENKEVLSVEPSGNYARRPEGTDAVWEQLKIVNGNLVTSHDSPFVIPFLYV